MTTLPAPWPTGSASPDARTFVRLQHLSPLKPTLPVSLLATLALVIGAGPANAQKQLPGLWEHTVTMKGGQMDAAMAQMQERLARMPPDQRKQFEAMMGAQGVGLVGGKPTSLQVCITPEQAARDTVPMSESDCNEISRERSGRTLRLKFTCQGRHKGSGEAEITFDSEKAHLGRMVITSTASGKPVRMEIEHSGRWLAAGCGEVKPRP